MYTPTIRPAMVVPQQLDFPDDKETTQVLKITSRKPYSLKVSHNLPDYFLHDIPRNVVSSTGRTEIRITFKGPQQNVPSNLFISIGGIVNGRRLGEFQVPVKFFDEKKQESDLKCPICNAEFEMNGDQTPMKLTCQKVICKDCAKKYSNGTWKSFHCPSCRRLKADELSESAKVKDLVYKTRFRKMRHQMNESVLRFKIAKKLETGKIDSCCQYNSTCFCPNCEKDFCHNCFVEVHSSPHLSGHKLYRIDEKPHLMPSGGQHPHATALVPCKTELEPHPHIVFPEMQQSCLTLQTVVKEESMQLQ